MYLNLTKYYNQNNGAISSVHIAIFTLNIKIKSQMGILVACTVVFRFNQCSYSDYLFL